MTRSDDMVVFQAVIEDLLFPLFPGSKFDTPAVVQPPKRNKDNLVTSAAGVGNVLKLQKKAGISKAVQIRRSQSFTPDELNVIQFFLMHAQRLYASWEEPYRSDLASSVMSEVVANCSAGNYATIAHRVLSVLADWSQQTYEGQRIAFSVGVEDQKEKHGTTFEEIEELDFLKVMSNGQDTLIVLDASGKVIRHESLKQDRESKGYSPYRFQRLAQWTQNDGRSLFSLSRNGEILAFKCGTLAFAKRRGRWRYFAHDAVVKQMTKDGVAKNTPEALRKALYLTALDVAFARTGGCLGIFNASAKKEGVGCLISDDDYMLNDATKNSKTKTLQHIIDGQKFQDLDRQLRLELASIDGATILDHEGVVLAVGAILSVNSGSTDGGGRSAATKAIAKYGLGMKISNDGYIRIYNRKDQCIVELA